MPLPLAQVLMQQTITRFQLHPTELSSPPMGADQAKLETLTFPDGKALPPSLKQWLAFDAQSIGLFSDLERLIISDSSLAATMGSAFNTMQRLLLPDPTYFLYPQQSNDAWWFLYAGQADEDGEYPVFLADVDDRYYVQLVAPNFAMWLAARHNVLEFNLYKWRDDPDFAMLMRKQSKLNFHNYRYCEIHGDAITAEGEKAQWCSEKTSSSILRSKASTSEQLIRYWVRIQAVFSSI